MASVTVFAELKLRDGRRQNISVHTENNLPALVDGIREVSGKVSTVLTELVERERARGGCADGEEEEEDSDEDDDPEDPLNSDLQPPAKRPKP
ncbi:uncharacterized protein ACBR49_016074 [Aulostomus maculatus]